MATGDFWELLRSRYNELTRSGRLVADYLAQHSEEAQYLSISALGAACGVAEATIFRFCRALGFAGYNEMKIALARANAAPGAAFRYELEPGTDTATLCTHASAVALEAIHGTRAALDPAAVDAAAALLQNARQVYCFGQGGSQLLANDIWARFASVCNKFHTAGDSHMQTICASLMGPGDVVLYVSYSGSTRDMMETLHVAKSNGAAVLLFTHNAASPGAALADVVLLCGAPESPVDSASIAAKIAVLFAAEVLEMRFTLDNRDETARARERTRRALDGKRL